MRTENPTDLKYTRGSHSTAPQRSLCPRRERSRTRQYVRWKGANQPLWGAGPNLGAKSGSPFNNSLQGEKLALGALNQGPPGAPGPCPSRATAPTRCGRRVMQVSQWQAGSCSHCLSRPSGRRPPLGARCPRNPQPDCYHRNIRMARKTRRALTPTNSSIGRARAPGACTRRRAPCPSMGYVPSLKGWQILTAGACESRLRALGESAAATSAPVWPAPHMTNKLPQENTPGSRRVCMAAARQCSWPGPAALASSPVAVAPALGSRTRARGAG